MREILSDRSIVRNASNPRHANRERVTGKPEVNCCKQILSFVVKFFSLGEVRRTLSLFALDQAQATAASRANSAGHTFDPS